MAVSKSWKAEAENSEFWTKMNVMGLNESKILTPARRILSLSNGRLTDVQISLWGTQKTMDIFRKTIISSTLKRLEINSYIDRGDPIFEVLCHGLRSLKNLVEFKANTYIDTLNRMMSWIVSHNSLENVRLCCPKAVYARAHQIHMAPVPQGLCTSQLKRLILSVDVEPAYTCGLLPPEDVSK
jgi:hypothetical protein